MTGIFGRQYCRDSNFCHFLDCPSLFLVFIFYGRFSYPVSLLVESLEASLGPDLTLSPFCDGYANTDNF